MTDYDALAMLYGALAPVAGHALGRWSSRWRHNRTLRRPLFGCFCDECEAASAGLRLAQDQAAAPEPIPPHVGSYRTNPRQQPSLPRKAPWWCYLGWHLWQYDRPAIRVGGLISYRYVCQRAGCCAVEERW